MDDLIKNKKLIVISICIVVLLGIVYLVKNRETNIEYDYQNNTNVEYLKNYKVNEYIPIYVEEADVVIKYMNYFKNSMLSDINYSYSLLNEEYRNKRFGSVDKYKEYVNDIISESFYSVEVKTYKVIHSGGSKYFDVYDTNDEHYIFKENSIMDFEVYLDNYTVKIK